jgi:hypothetical protein
MAIQNSSFRFGSKYATYLTTSKPKTIDKVEPPKTHHGRIDAGWDDYEQDIIEEVGDGRGIRLYRGG